MEFPRLSVECGSIILLSGRLSCESYIHTPNFVISRIPLTTILRRRALLAERENLPREMRLVGAHVQICVYASLSGCAHAIYSRYPRLYQNCSWRRSVSIVSIDCVLGSGTTGRGLLNYSRKTWGWGNMGTQSVANNVLWQWRYMRIVFHILKRERVDDQFVFPERWLVWDTD
jgi:hypothetical protein